MSGVPVTVLTGFLGAGKTSLLAELLADPAMAGTAVIINEFGEIGLDHDLLESASETMVELASGCLCCTVRGDLVETLGNLVPRLNKAGGQRIMRVVIETTGLADPAPIIHTLMSDPRLGQAYRLDGVVTLVDAVNGDATLDAQVEAVKQAAVADRLVLTKADLARDPASRRDIGRLRDRLAALNPAARLLDRAAGEASPATLFNCGLYNPETKTADVQAWLRAESYGNTTPLAPEDSGLDPHHGLAHHQHHHHDVNRHDDRIRAYCITRKAPISGVAFSFFLDVLRAHHGENLLRVKGIVNIAEQPGRPAVIHGVQHVFHPVHWMEAWPGDDHRTRIVFIVRDISKDSIEGLLEALDRQTALSTNQPSTGDQKALI